MCDCCLLLFLSQALLSALLLKTLKLLIIIYYICCLLTFLFNTIFQIKLNLPVIQTWIGNTRLSNVWKLLTVSTSLSLHTVRLHEDALTITSFGHSILHCVTVLSGGASITALTEAGSCLGFLRSPLWQKTKKDSIALALSFVFTVIYAGPFIRCATKEAQAA